VEALSDEARLTSCLSVAYIGPKSEIERPRKTKIGTKVGHVTRDSEIQGQKVKGQLVGGILWRPPAQLVLHGSIIGGPNCDVVSAGRAARGAARLFCAVRYSSRCSPFITRVRCIVTCELDVDAVSIPSTVPYSTLSQPVHQCSAVRE